MGQVNVFSGKPHLENSVKSAEAFWAFKFGKLVQEGLLQNSAYSDSWVVDPFSK